MTTIQWIRGLAGVLSLMLLSQAATCSAQIFFQFGIDLDYPVVGGVPAAMGQHMSLDFSISQPPSAGYFGSASKFSVDGVSVDLQTDGGTTLHGFGAYTAWASGVNPTGSLGITLNGAFVPGDGLVIRLSSPSLLYTGPGTAPTFVEFPNSLFTGDFDYYPNSKSKPINGIFTSAAYSATQVPEPLPTTLTGASLLAAFAIASRRRG